MLRCWLGPHLAPLLLSISNNHQQSLDRPASKATSRQKKEISVRVETVLKASQAQPGINCKLSAVYQVCTGTVYTHARIM